MGIEKLLQDYNIPYINEGHKHSTDGWVNIHCPFCTGSQDYHMGIHEEMTGCHCWRCGGHSMTNTLSKILDISNGEAWHIIEQYRTNGIVRKKVAEPKVSINPLKFPTPNIQLNKYGTAYLERRGFNPEYIEQQWEVMQTGPTSFLDGISYDNRILIPIKWEGKVVSFQTRDITNKSPKKYLVCPMNRETIHHKNIVYGDYETLATSKTIIIVEGVFDVWKLGTYSCATFGTSFKMEQVLALAKFDANFFIVFDNEGPAQEQARQLMVKLKMLRKNVQLEHVKDDPGSMSIGNANYFVQQLIKRRS